MLAKKISWTALISGAFAALILLISQPSSAAGNRPEEPGKIYVSDVGAHSMLRMAMDGTQVETLFQLPADTGPLAVVLDPLGERMFYIERARGFRAIYSADMDGQNRQALPTSFGHPNTLALDFRHNRLLWSLADKIGESDFDGRNSAFQLHPGPVDPWDIFVDELNDLVYWTGDSGIFASHFDGSDTVNVPSGYRYPLVAAIALDAQAGEIYSASFSATDYQIERSNIQTYERETIIPSHSGRVGGLALDLAQGKIYWSATQNSGVIKRANLDGTAEETLVKGLQSPIGIALDTTNQRIYWVDWGAQKIQSAPMTGGKAVDLRITAPQKPRDIIVDAQAGLIYWTGEGGAAVSRAKLDGSEAVVLINYAQSASRGIGLDATNGRLYWSDARQKAVMAAEIDGSGLTTLLVKRLEDAQGLAFDPLEDKIYWADFSRDIIARANRDGTGYEELVTNGLILPTSVAVDPLRGKFYWVDQFRHHIARANLDGSGVEELLGEGDGLKRPNVILLDVANGKLYWTDLGTRTLQRANLDGTGAAILHSGMIIPSGIALDQPPAYYSRNFIPLIAAQD